MEGNNKQRHIEIFGKVCTEFVDRWVRRRYDTLFQKRSALQNWKRNTCIPVVYTQWKRWKSINWYRWWRQRHDGASIYVGRLQSTERRIPTNASIIISLLKGEVTVIDWNDDCWWLERLFQGYQYSHFSSDSPAELIRFHLPPLWLLFCLFAFLSLQISTLYYTIKKICHYFFAN